MPLWRLWVTAGAGSPQEQGVLALQRSIRACGNPVLPPHPTPGRGWGCSEGARRELLSPWVGGIPGPGAAEGLVITFCPGRGSGVALADLSPCCSWSSGTVTLSSCSPCKGTAVQGRKGKR